MTDSRGGDSFVSGSNPADQKPAAADTAGAAAPPAVKAEVKAGSGKDKAEVKPAVGKDAGAARVSAAKDKVSAGKDKS